MSSQSISGLSSAALYNGPRKLDNKNKKNKLIKKVILSHYNPRLNRTENTTKINPSGAIKFFSDHISKNADQILKAFNQN